MADDINFVEIPISYDRDNIQYVNVQFKYDTPNSKEKQGDNGTYTAYSWGCHTEDIGGTFAVDSILYFYTGLYKALHDMGGVPGNLDNRGKKIKHYRPTKGTVVEIGCYQSRPGDTKSNEYEVYHKSGPFVEVALVQPQQSPASKQSSNGAQPQQGGNQMISKQQVADGSLYHPDDPVREGVYLAIARDFMGYYFQVYGQVKEQLGGEEADLEAVRTIATHICIATEKEFFRYHGVAGEEATASPDVEEFPAPEGADTNVWNELVRVGTLSNKSDQVSGFFDALIQYTPTQNEYSCKAALKLMGISTVPAGPAAKYDAYSKLAEYYVYRQSGDDPETAAGKVVARYEAV